jgi:hypothetical protein
VQEGALVVGALVVDDVRDVLDVDAAGRDVGRDEHVDLAAAERAQRLLAGALAEVAVHGGAAKPRSTMSAATLSQVRLVRQNTIVRPGPRTAGCAQHLALVHRVRAVDEDRVSGTVRFSSGLLGADVRRLLHEAAGHRHDRPGHVAENSMVWRSRRELLEDALDVGQEAQVEHLVGLVEDQDTDLAQDQVALLGEVEQPAGGADDDLDAGLQRGDLRLEGRPP